MAYLDRIEAANRRDLTGFLRFEIAGQPVGAVRAAFAARLAEFPGVFRVVGAKLCLASGLDEPGVAASVRSHAVGEVLSALRGQGVFGGWREEQYAVGRTWGDPPLLTMERAAIPFFGITGYGVHMNGYVRSARGLHLWVATRARDRPTDPGKLDQIVAGGQPANLGLRENLVKECAEEAGIGRELAQGARSTGVVTYALTNQQGLRPDVLFVFDLELPPSFEPCNTDGEVESFALWPIDRVAEVVRDTDRFKFNCALVVTDFLIRQGVIGPEDPAFCDLVSGLRGRERFLAAWHGSPTRARPHATGTTRR